MATKKSKNTQVKITLPTDVVEKLKVKADKNGLALSAYLRLLVVHNCEIKSSDMKKNNEEKELLESFSTRRIEDIF
ncbi:MAG: hypothetical protein LBG64_01220 [Pseudomonadales bacterium]|jgi:hypothetical protein|nr:hypothetical protein [Pseudomonadales bacterium]